jgi:hypothetical protein
MRVGIWLLAATLCACGGSGGVRSIEDNWQATDQVAGGTLTLSLNEERGGVAGSGTYTTASGAAGTLLVTGSSQSGASVHLFWTYDMGDRAEYVATLSDDNHMSGTLTTQSGSTTQTQALVFVRE